MTASADKVQFLLENSLEETLPLVKKGIFSEQQLKQIMLERQKHQNKLYSKTFKLSHYLKAIEFQYDLERQRLFKIKEFTEDQNTNPLFRKQGKTDFSIVKRILKLWDRTMHKYRFRTYLWKQYLSFCIAIRSKKHFYKVLTNSLRFLPLQLDIWKIGVRYEVQIGRNLWKARKLLHKGLKLLPAGIKNIQLTKELIKFQLEFVQMLQTREKIIQGQDESAKNNIKFIITDSNNQNKNKESSNEQDNQKSFVSNQQANELLKLRQYHQVLLVALLDSIEKNSKSKTFFLGQDNLSPSQKWSIIHKIFKQYLVEVCQKQESELIQYILKQTLVKLNNYQYQLTIAIQEESQSELNEENEKNEKKSSLEQLHSQIIVERKEESTQKNNQTLSGLKKEELYAQQILQIYQQKGDFNQKHFTKIIKQFCLKPSQLSRFLEPLLTHLLSQVLHSLKSNQWLRIPLNSLKIILEKLNMKNQKQKIVNQEALVIYLTKQLDKISSLQYINHTQLLKEVVQFNKRLGQMELNNKIYRSILVNSKQNHVLIERVRSFFIE